MKQTAHGPVVWVERLLLVVGVVCLGWYGYATASAAAFQSEQRARFQRAIAVPPRGDAPPVAAGARAADTDRAQAHAADPLLGLIEIPRLGLSATVMSGDDDSVLAASAGHLPDTPHPWEAGNSVIAAHRDGLFRSLEGIRRGDRILLRTRRGDLEYRVDEMRIVRPSDLSVLQPRRTDSVTLITCYPFNFIGAAPQRFIVHAERIGGYADASDLLPSRSLAVVTAYGVAPSQVSGAALARVSAEGSREGPRVKPRPRAARVSVGTGRSARNVDAGARRDRRETVTPRNRKPADRPTDSDRHEKRRRWYHFWRR